MTPAVTPTGSEILNLAVIGAGRWGRTLIRTIGLMPDLRLAAVISSSSVVAEIEAGVPVFTDWREAVQTVPVDGIVLAVPPDRQPDIAEPIIASGMPVFLEKPLALDRAQATRLLDAARQYGFTGLVNHLHLFTSEFCELIRRARQSGPVRAIETVSGGRGPHRMRWSACWDWGPHDVAMTLIAMADTPETVSAEIVDRVEEGGRILENYRLVLTFENGGSARIYTGNAFAKRQRSFRVTLGDQDLVYTEAENHTRSLAIERQTDKISVPVASVAPLNAALAVFAERVRSKTGGLADLELGAQIVDVLAAAHESVLLNRPVSLARG